MERAPLFLSSARMLINNCQFVGGARRNRKTVRYHGVTRREGWIRRWRHGLPKTRFADERRRAISSYQQRYMKSGKRRERERGSRSPWRLVNWRNGSEKRGSIGAKKRTEVVNVDDAWITMYWRLHHSSRRSLCVPLPLLSLSLSFFLSFSLLLFSIFYGEIYHLRVVYSICFIEITSRAQPLPSARPDTATIVRRPNFIATIFEDLLLTRASKVRESYKHINCFWTFRIYNFHVYIFTHIYTHSQL